MGNSAVVDETAARARADEIAAWLNHPAPDRILDGDTVAGELGAFCQETGASLDWILTGDIRAMVNLCFHRAVARKEGEAVYAKASLAQSLLKACQVATEDETSGIPFGERGIAATLEHAAGLCSEVVEGIERIK